MAMAPALAPFVTVVTVEPRRIVNETVPRSSGPSWSWKVAVMLPPQSPLATKV
jgi:hypothetical protein